jgi:hypothetical protein
VDAALEDHAASLELIGVAAGCRFVLQLSKEHNYFFWLYLSYVGLELYLVLLAFFHWPSKHSMELWCPHESAYLVWLAGGGRLWISHPHVQHESLESLGPVAMACHKQRHASPQATHLLLCQKEQEPEAFAPTAGSKDLRETLPVQCLEGTYSINPPSPPGAQGGVRCIISDA